MKKTQHERQNEYGQALVEFVILLIIIGAMCLGMLYSSRLLTFEFWAQQEARYIAFEQEWVARDGGSDPDTQLTNDRYFHRPPVIHRVPQNLETEQDGGLTQLVSLSPGEREEQERRSLARSPVLRTLRFDEVNELFVPSAVASQWLTRETQLTSEGLQIKPSPKPSNGYLEGNQLEQKVRVFLEIAETGVNICTLQRGLLHKYHLRTRLDHPAALQECSRRFNDQFSRALVRGTDLRELFLEAGRGTEQGWSDRQAIRGTLEHAIASGFYSLFDTTVRNEADDAVSTINSSWIDIALETAGDDEVSRLISELRYLGSNIAMVTMMTELGILMTQDTDNRDVPSEKSFEDNLRDVLFIDAEDPIGIGVGGFMLAPDYLPIPPFIDGMFSMMFDGVMRNVLNEEDSLVDPLIDESNKLVNVQFSVRTGIQLPVSRKFNNTNMNIRSRFYLVTQPWHITRRENGPGGYRDKGGQDDEIDMETEEAVLRRRTFGLWLFPAQPISLISPIMGVLSDELDLSGVISVFQGFDDFIGDMKSFIFNDNPLKKIGDAFEDIPVIGNLDITLPEFPAVRPDAYPRTKELRGDKLACSKASAGSCPERDFDDYVKEQRDNNPDPDPEFN